MNSVNLFLSQEELRWLDLFWSINFKYRSQLQQQIATAKIKREFTDYYIFLNFICDANSYPLPRFNDRVPIEVLVQHFEGAETQKRVGYIQPSLGPGIPIKMDRHREMATSFLMHIYGGFVRQLEIYNLDSSKLKRDGMCTGRADYRISPDFL